MDKETLAPSEVTRILEENKKLQEDNAKLQELNKKFYTYKDYCDQLYMQNKELTNRLQMMVNDSNKLPSLFHVLKFNQFFEESYVTECANQIKDILQNGFKLPEDPLNKSTEKDK